MLKSTTSTIRLLVLLHVAAGLAVTFLVTPDFSVAVLAFLATLFAETGLLGILAGLGTQSLPVRLIEAIVGLAYLCVLTYYAVPGGVPEWCALLAIATLVVACVLGILRRRGLALRTLDAAEQANLDEPLRFGIRHLLAWILVTAVLVRIGQSLDPNGTLGILFCYGLIFAVVPVVAPWAALGGKRPMLRGAILILAAAVTGIAGPLYQREHTADAIGIFASATALQAFILLASLGLLRRTGLRLVRREMIGLEEEIIPEMK